MKTWQKTAVLFGIGGFGYGLIEIMWRGYTHWTMAVAGGLSLVMLSRVERFRQRSRVCKAALFALGVTGIELVFGLIFNRLLKMHVWDYSDQPLNLFGQICLLYSVLWGVLGLLMMPLVHKFNRSFLQ